MAINTPNDLPGGSRPFQDRPRRPLTGAAFSPAQRADIQQIVRAELADAVSRIVAAIKEASGRDLKIVNVAANPLPPAPIGAAADFSAAAAAKATEDTAQSPQPAGATGTPPAPAGLVDHTEQDTPGATPGMLALINEQTNPEWRAALREIAMKDEPHQTRLPKMRNKLAELKAANP